MNFNFDAKTIAILKDCNPLFISYYDIAIDSCMKPQLTDNLEDILLSFFNNSDIIIREEIKNA